MKTVLIPSFPVILVIVTSLLLPGCKKDDDHPDHHLPCRIQQIKGDLGYSLEDSAVFVYNAKGDPVSVTKTVAATGSPNYLFRYDVHRRLTGFIGVYSDGLHFEFWHRYGYDSKNRIVQDTTYTFGALTDPPLQGFLERITTYTYDAKNRIIRQDGLHPSSGNTYVIRYYYNQQGNLEKIEEGSFVTLLTYDNKVNMHRTHPVWQFLDRDFSVNNPFEAVSYNTRGLPVKIEFDDTKFDKNFIGITYRHLELSYQCH